MIGLHVDLMIHRHQAALARTNTKEQDSNVPVSRERTNSTSHPQQQHMHTAPTQTHTLETSSRSNKHIESATVSHRHPSSQRAHHVDAPFRESESGMYGASSIKPDPGYPLPSVSGASNSFHRHQQESAAPFDPLSSSFSPLASVGGIMHNVMRQSVDSFAPYGTAPGDPSSHSLEMQSQYLGSSSMMDDADDVPDLFAATDMQVRCAR